MRTISKTFIYTSLLCSLLMLLQSSSCKRDNGHEETVCTPQNTVPVPQDMKDRFFFKEGTYWIYRNVSSNETDSIWVWISYNDSRSVNEEDYGNIKDKCYETFSTNTRSRNFPDEFSYNKTGIQIYPQKGQNLTNELFGLQESPGFNPNEVIYRLENRGGIYENQMGAQIEYVDSITVADSLTYKNILRIYYDPGVSTYDYLRDMYYAKNIGLVKFKRNTDNSEWELIRSHVVQ